MSESESKNKVMRKIATRSAEAQKRRYNPYNAAPIEILPMQINFDEENNEIHFIKPTFDEITNLFKINNTCSNVLNLYALNSRVLTNLVRFSNHNAIYALKDNSLQGIAFLEHEHTRPPGLPFEKFINLSYPCTIPNQGIGSAMFDYACRKATELNCGLYNRMVEQSQIFWEKMYKRLDSSKWTIHKHGHRIWALPSKRANPSLP